MRTDIYINAASNESRIAIVEDGRLAELWVERPENQRMVGDIYKGTVTAVLPGLQAAFVDIGQERTAFLQARDMMDPGAEEDGGGSSRGRRRFQSQSLVEPGREPQKGKEACDIGKGGKNHTAGQGRVNIGAFQPQRQ